MKKEGNYNHLHTQPKMKREVRQHGVVRTSPTPSVSGPQSRQNELGSASTAGTFNWVTPIPTNKYGRRKSDICHVTLAGKSKDKVKGAQKMRSSSEVLNNVSGFKSAKAVLHYLDDHEYDDESYDHHEIEEIDGVEHDI